MHLAKFWCTIQLPPTCLRTGVKKAPLIIHRRLGVSNCLERNQTSHEVHRRANVLVIGVENNIKTMYYLKLHALAGVEICRRHYRKC
jgi:hypothetical protein